jgi:hypothetical protein
LGVGLQPYPVKEKIIEKPLRKKKGGQGLNWAVEPRGERERGRERERERESRTLRFSMVNSSLSFNTIMSQFV